MEVFLFLEGEVGQVVPHPDVREAVAEVAVVKFLVAELGEDVVDGGDGHGRFQEMYFTPASVYPSDSVRTAPESGVGVKLRCWAVLGERWQGDFPRARAKHRVLSSWVDSRSSSVPDWLNESATAYSAEMRLKAAGQREE